MNNLISLAAFVVFVAACIGILFNARGLGSFLLLLLLDYGLFKLIGYLGQMYGSLATLCAALFILVVACVISIAIDPSTPSE